MDILKLRDGKKLLAELDKLNKTKLDYELSGFNVVVSGRYLQLTEEEKEAVSKIFMDKLDAQIAEIEQKIAEL